MVNTTKVKLNTFQRTILLWNEIHPYNAVHIVRIPQTLNVTRLKDIVNSRLEDSGLAGLTIDYKKKRFHYIGGPANIEIKVIENKENTLVSLCSEIQEQLNTPFAKIPPRPPISNPPIPPLPKGGKRGLSGRREDFKVNPFRFFVAKERDSFYLGLVYFHLISGADSIVILLKNIVNLYMDGKASATYLPLDIYTKGYRYLIPKNLKYLIGWILTLPENIANLRKSFRPRYSDLNDQRIGFSYFCIKPPQFQLLVKTVKKWGVTLNDMFMAILLKSLSPLASKRISAPRRKKISIASIVNIRRDLSANSPETFGLFLSSFSVSHTVPDEIPLEQLIKDIHRQTEKTKKHKLYLRTIMELEVALLLVTLFFKKRKKKFYSKYYPLWGGITNINLNALWKHADDKIPVDYFRAVSTGPATPVVFSFTTVNDVLNIGVSFRTTVFSKADVERITSDFSNYISTLKDA